MKTYLLFFVALLLLFISCDDDTKVFEKDADTRVAEAIASLKEKLVAPPDGWLLKYRPDSEFGAYYVLLKFEENGEVNIKTDLGVNEGEFFDQTITYRIDNSLGLELIFENYSFFSYLFEQDNASFPAEFELNYVNETGDGDLVFNSKTDVPPATIIALQQAVPENNNLLGTGISENISKMTVGLAPFASVLKLSYTQKDVALYMTLDELERTIQINYISSKNSINNGQKLDFSSGYILEGNAIVLDDPLTGSFQGSTISIEKIALDELTSNDTQICMDTLTVYNYSGELSSNDPITLETSVFDPEGAIFAQSFGFFDAPITDRFLSVLDEEGMFADDQIVEDIPGASDIQIYFGAGQDGSLNAMGFRIENPNATVTFALREFEYAIEGNKVQFDFAPEYTLFGDTTVTINAEAMNKYLDIFTESGNTSVYRLSDTVYEFYNPCNRWSFFFFADNI